MAWQTGRASVNAETDRDPLSPDGGVFFSSLARACSRAPISTSWWRRESERSRTVLGVRAIFKASFDKANRTSNRLGARPRSSNPV